MVHSIKFWHACHMPLVFSYGRLQRDDVQVSVLGRQLKGTKTRLLGYERVLIDIKDREHAAAHGAGHYENLIPASRSDNAVEGMALEVTDDELLDLDRYDALDGYTRIAIVLATGQNAWVYVHE